ncbi:hypothetical protein CWI36_0826p0010 [Hamiltosporidium magnivora]|uniref:Uncharacterized protein n=1 Tax=Hamiltosporidium magnivora TaxID=148818 RepID=A0A4Q9L8E8_9MICR|nr:hypothetical protein CWI36_0826p0010 [Hamiltosporidium magnivora]
MFFYIESHETQIKISLIHRILDIVKRGDSISKLLYDGYRSKNTFYTLTLGHENIEKNDFEVVKISSSDNKARICEKYCLARSENIPNKFILDFLSKDEILSPRNDYNQPKYNQIKISVLSKIQDEFNEVVHDIPDLKIESNNFRNDDIVYQKASSDSFFSKLKEKIDHVKNFGIKNKIDFTELYIFCQEIIEYEKYLFKKTKGKEILKRTKVLDINHSLCLIKKNSRFAVLSEVFFFFTLYPEKISNIIRQNNFIYVSFLLRIFALQIIKVLPKDQDDFEIEEYLLFKSQLNTMFFLNLSPRFQIEDDVRYRKIIVLIGIVCYAKALNLNDLNIYLLRLTFSNLTNIFSILKNLSHVFLDNKHNIFYASLSESCERIYIVTRKEKIDKYSKAGESFPNPVSREKYIWEFLLKLEQAIFKNYETNELNMEITDDLIEKVNTRISLFSL